MSLAAVVSALYLSPLGSSAAHSNNPFETVKTAMAGREKGSHEQKTHTPASTVPVKTVVDKPSPAEIIKEILYLPPTPRPATTTTTIARTTTTLPEPTTTSTTVPSFTVPNKAELIDPTSDYWGVAITGVPQGTSQLDALDTEVGHAPSELTWFQGWDEPYPAQTVQTSWQHGALPMITWQSRPTNDTDPAQSDPAYSLSDIIEGNYDNYLQTFAKAVVSEGLPVVIRLDQEMNGNWFPWSEGVYGNTAGQFIQMWRHVWNIFQAAGANTYVIWLWAPNRTYSPNAPAFSDFYPGNGYVDWIGVDAYWRRTNDSPTFAAVLGPSVAGLEALTSKPLFIAETGAIETDPTTGSDLASEKEQFTTSFLQSVASDPHIIGFSWFDNVAINYADGIPILNDWRIDSDPANLLAFKSGVATGRFTDGLMPTSQPVRITPVPANPGSN